ncbi:Chromodomain containing hypothetical protein [Phytophthora palmivora]|uniref:Integrase zinc-binding domain-containing protein n=1 Tax=Phytophthora palmivora TaxID=4796 RepID=A0A2P4XGU2_9STRA|nr:Chromodomain containing hypothetical protein [Phytophthora palmivora]
MAYDYEICDIAGYENVWADLLSRWGSTLPHICAIRLVPYEYSPTLQEDFKWPTFSDVIDSQGGAVRPGDMDLTADTHGVLRLTAGQIWIPAEDGLLQLRICIVGHFGVAGHRGLDTTVTAIAKRFWWADLLADVKFFVGRCLHCVSVVGGPPVSRPLGEAMHAERPNELIHWDYLFMGESSGEDKYILVIKDDASNFWGLPVVGE